MPEPLLSREWRLIDAGHTTHSVPSTWDVYEVEFYSSYAVGPLRCEGLLKPASITASSVFSTAQLAWDVFSTNAPEEAIDGVVKWGNGWRSANFSEPGSWLQVSFPSKTTVQCVRLYQESIDNGAFEYVISKVALQGLDESLGAWTETSSWRAGSEDMGSRFQVLPGWRWITLAAGLYLDLAASECPEPSQAADPAAMHFCCVWPKLSNAPTSGWLEWVEEGDHGGGGGRRRRCSDGATVKSGRRCQVKSTSCHSSGDLECVNGRMVLNMIGEDAEGNDVTAGHQGCIQQQVDELTHVTGDEPVIQVEAISYSPYCPRFTISDHPLDLYNGEYVRQPGSRNGKPWFANGQLGKLYWFDGCDSGEPGWSLDNRPFLSSGCNREQRGGWRPAPDVGGLPSGTLEWQAGEMAAGGTWELDCNGSQYALLGTGDCRDDRGRSANAYYQLGQHTDLTCKSQCDTDPHCVAYHYVPPALGPEPGRGSCWAYAPAREAQGHPQGTGWLFVAGDGATEVTAALFASDGEERGTGWCFLKVDWQEGSDPPSSGRLGDAATLPGKAAAFSDRFGSVAVALVAMLCVGCLVVAAGCAIRRRSAKDPERATLADDRGDFVHGAVVEEGGYADSPNNSVVVGKPLGAQRPPVHKPYVHSVYGGAIYGGAARAAAGPAGGPAGVEKPRTFPAGGPSTTQGFPVQTPDTPLGRRSSDPLVATTPGSVAATPSDAGPVGQAPFRWPRPEGQPEEEPQFPLEVELDTSGARASAVRAGARLGAAHGAQQAGRDPLGWRGSDPRAGPTTPPADAGNQRLPERLPSDDLLSRATSSTALKAEPRAAS